MGVAPLSLRRVGIPCFRVCLHPSISGTEQQLIHVHKTQGIFGSFTVLLTFPTFLSCRFFIHVNQLAALDEFPLVAPTPLIMVVEAAVFAAHDEPAFLLVPLIQFQFAFALRTVHFLALSQNPLDEVDDVAVRRVADESADKPRNEYG